MNGEASKRGSSEEREGIQAQRRNKGERVKNKFKRQN